MLYYWGSPHINYKILKYIIVFIPPLTAPLQGVQKEEGMAMRKGMKEGNYKSCNGLYGRDY